MFIFKCLPILMDDVLHYTNGSTNVTLLYLSYPPILMVLFSNLSINILAKDGTIFVILMLQKMISVKSDGLLATRWVQGLSIWYQDAALVSNFSKSLFLGKFGITWCDIHTFYIMLALPYRLSWLDQQYMVENSMKNQIYILSLDHDCLKAV
jgi:hypothetical protein